MARAGLGGTNLEDLLMLDPSNLDHLVWIDLTDAATGTPPPARSYHSMTSSGTRLFVFGGWAGFTGVGAKSFSLALCVLVCACACVCLHAHEIVSDILHWALQSLISSFLYRTYIKFWQTLRS